MTDDATTPWWRSQGSALEADEDPVALHLAARNGVPTDHGHGGTGSSRGAGIRGSARAGADGSGAAGPGPSHAHGPEQVSGDCAVCPICRGLAHVRTTHPELADHLVEAARHLTLAVREVMDGLAAGRQDGAGDGDPTSADAGPDRPGRSERGGGTGRPRADHGTGPPRTTRRGRQQAHGFESIPIDDAEEAE